MSDYYNLLQSPSAHSFVVPLRLAGFTGDLSAMTAPPFILSPTSLTEFPGAIRRLSNISEMTIVCFKLTGASLREEVCLLLHDPQAHSKLVNPTSCMPLNPVLGE